MKKVIVIDDQKIVTHTATTFLTRLGFEVHAFNSAIDALMFYKNESVDLVLTDLNMPHINGFEIIRRLKGPNKKKVDVIAMSAVFKSSEDIKKAVRLGVKDFILKPFDFDVLAKKISYLTERKQVWSEWKIDKSRNANRGNMINSVELISISEVSLTIKSEIHMQPGWITTISFDILSENNISTLVLEVLDSVAENNGYICKLKILGLKETEAKKIRQLCRALDSFQLRLNAKKSA